MRVERVVFEQRRHHRPRCAARGRRPSRRDRSVHAAVITPRPEWEATRTNRIVEVNLVGTVNALEVARSLPEFERFVYVSSCAVWGDQPGVAELTEDVLPTPAGCTPSPNYTSESICRRYAESVRSRHCFHAAIECLGPMERDTPGYRGGTEPREMLRLHFEGKPILVNSLDGPWRDWTYVEDIAEGSNAPGRRRICRTRSTRSPAAGSSRSVMSWLLQTPPARSRIPCRPGI